MASDTEKLRSNSEYVTGNVHPMFRSSKRSGYWISLHFLMALANVSGISSQSTVDHFLFHNINSWSTASGFGRSLSYILSSSRNLVESSSQIIEGAKQNLTSNIMRFLEPYRYFRYYSVQKRYDQRLLIIYKWCFCRYIISVACLITVLGITSMQNLSAIHKAYW